ncbi:MAG: 4Fe-4S binding protein [Firmicutes bacterium]|nr:4Fe-4S binding protein [Bacillota bacterium]
MINFKQIIHQWSWLVLALFLTAGFIYPVAGILALICMIAPVITAFFKGRNWCGHYCPRGSLNDQILVKLTQRSQTPAFMKTAWFKLVFLGLLMGAFMVQIIMAGGNLIAIGNVFLRMVLITTLISIILGIIYQPRTWCMICPMGTLAHYAARLKTAQARIPPVVFHKSRCSDCRICSRNCPLQIDVHSFKESGKINHPDCLKCYTCISKCPKKSLSIA